MRSKLILMPNLPEMSPNARANLNRLVAGFALSRETSDELPAVVADVGTPEGYAVGAIYTSPDALQRALTTASASAWLAHLTKPNEVIWACDTFLAFDHLDPEAPDFVPPSENPNATEALSMMYARPGRLWALSIPYGWTDDGIDFRVAMTRWREWEGRREPIQFAVEIAVLAKAQTIEPPEGMTAATLHEYGVIDIGPLDTGEMN